MVWLVQAATDALAGLIFMQLVLIPACVVVQFKCQLCLHVFVGHIDHASSPGTYIVGGLLELAFKSCVS
jgi:hypothetical protein